MKIFYFEIESFIKIKTEDLHVSINIGILIRNIVMIIKKKKIDQTLSDQEENGKEETLFSR